MKKISKKKSHQKKNKKNKNEKSVIYLDPENIKDIERTKAAKLEIIKEIARTGNLQKLEELKQFDEDNIKEPIFTEQELNANYRAGVYDGLDIAENEKKAYHGKRTAKASRTKDEQRQIKEEYVLEAYIRMINDKTKRAQLEGISESRMALLVKESVEEALKNAKTSNHKPVLKGKVSRKKTLTFTGLSPRTIIRILRNRDKKKISFYPWSNKEV